MPLAPALCARLPQRQSPLFEAHQRYLLESCPNPKSDALNKSMMCISLNNAAILSMGIENMLDRTPLSLARLIVISIWKSSEHPLLHLHTPNNGMDGTFSISMQRIITCRQLLQLCDNFVGDFWLQKLRFNLG